MGQFVSIGRDNEHALFLYRSGSKSQEEGRKQHGLKGSHTRHTQLPLNQRTKILGQQSRFLDARNLFSSKKDMTLKD
jgi:hypothetical protein